LSADHSPDHKQHSTLVWARRRSGCGPLTYVSRTGGTLVDPATSSGHPGILTCGYGLQWTVWIPHADLRIRRLGVRVPPSAPPSPQVDALSALRPAYPRHHLAGFWPDRWAFRCTTDASSDVVLGSGCPVPIGLGCGSASRSAGTHLRSAAPAHLRRTRRFPCHGGGRPAAECGTGRPAFSSGQDERGA
jgi:hypothetical protein